MSTEHAVAASWVRGGTRFQWPDGNWNPLEVWKTMPAWSVANSELALFGRTISWERSAQKPSGSEAACFSHLQHDPYATRKKFLGAYFETPDSRIAAPPSSSSALASSTTATTTTATTSLRPWAGVLAKDTKPWRFLVVDPTPLTAAGLCVEDLPQWGFIKHTDTDKKDMEVWYRRPAPTQPGGQPKYALVHWLEDLCLLGELNRDNDKDGSCDVGMPDFCTAIVLEANGFEKLPRRSEGAAPKPAENDAQEPLLKKQRTGY